MKSIILLSGGLDSTVALAISEPDVVAALTIDYGQRHRREIDAARKIAEFYEVDHHVASIDPILFGVSALTNTNVLIPEGHAEAPDTTYVPARNTVLLALGAAFAESQGARGVIIGANADDAAGYPDCRPRYIEAYRNVLNEGTLNHVWIHTPLMYMTKAEVLRTAHAYAVPIEMTWSCYRGGEQPCGACGACAGRGDHAVPR